MLATTACKFGVHVPYDDWLEKFDNDQAPDISAKGKKVNFRGIIKENPKEVIVVVQAL